MGRKGTNTYLGFEEVLGTSDALQGNIDLRELGQCQQPTVLLQLTGSSLVKDEQELRKGEAQRVTVTPDVSPTRVQYTLWPEQMTFLSSI